MNDRFAGIDSNTISIGSVDFTWTISPFDVSMDSFLSLILRLSLLSAWIEITEFSAPLSRAT